LMLSERLRSVIADPANPASAAGRARKRRWQRFAEAFPEACNLRVIDLGGTVESWRQCPYRPAHLTILNIDADDDTTELDGTPVVVRRGDACNVPEWIRSQRFDLAYSNSVIEHLGGHQRRRLFALTVRSLAPRYWVQTPYRYFPIEPHFLFPGAQFLPPAGRAWIARHWRIAHVHDTDVNASMEAATGIELLALTQFQAYFPDAGIFVERFAGLVKSLVAIRHSRAEPLRVRPEIGFEWS
jgi:hypothetical protein